MNKNDFINEIIKGFPESFKKTNIEVEKRKYELVLEDDLDFDKLYQLFLKSWTWKTAPQPAYFQKFMVYCRNPLKLISMPAPKRAALIKIANWLNTEEYTKCLYSRTKAPFHIRELQREQNFTKEELDQARISSEIV